MAMQKKIAVRSGLTLLCTKHNNRDMNLDFFYSAHKKKSRSRNFLRLCTVLYVHLKDVDRYLTCLEYRFSPRLVESIPDPWCNIMIYPTVVK